MDSFSHKATKHLLVFFFLLTSICLAALASAADISATKLPDVNAFIGEQSCIHSELSNTGTPDYGPYIIISVTEKTVLDFVSRFR